MIWGGHFDLSTNRLFLPLESTPMQPGAAKGGRSAKKRKRKQPQQAQRQVQQQQQQQQQPQQQQSKKKRRVTTSRLHTLTGAEATGAGSVAAAAVGRRAKESELGVVRAQGPVPPWAPLPALGVVPRAADVAAALEALRAEKLDQLRQVLRQLCEENGLESPPQLAFERWRFGCAMHAEQQTGTGSGAVNVQPVPPPDQAASTKAAPTAPDTKKKKKKKKRSGCGADEEPLVPSGGGDGGGLVSDLLRAGLTVEKADAIAGGLDAAARAASEAVRAEAARYDRGAAVPSKCVPAVAFHRHSIDLKLGKCFVKLTREAYGKLCELHRRHAPVGERLPPLALSLPDSEKDGYDGAEADTAAAELSSGSGSKGNGKGKGGSSSSSKNVAAAVAARAAVHARLFALLQRYKALLGAGFHAACPPAVFEVLRSRLGERSAYARAVYCQSRRPVLPRQA